MSRRFVLFHQAGRLAGMAQIQGTDDELVTQLQGHPLPETMGPFTFPDGRVAGLRLHRNTKTYVGYMEVVA